MLRLGEDDAAEAKTVVTVHKDHINVAWNQRKSTIDVHINHEKCAGKGRTEYLPQDVVFEIFLHLPAHVLHDVVRHVRREWNLMIRSPSFTHRHLQDSCGGLMIQEQSTPSNVIYVEMRRGCLGIYKCCNYGLRDLVWTSCAGLVLVPEVREGLQMISVMNPSTKKRTILPLVSSRIGHHRNYLSYSLAFAEASMEYKVVHRHEDEQFRMWKQISVLTIGVDKVWRRIVVEHLCPVTRYALMSLPFVTGGYIHWIGITFVLTLNVETETVQQFPLPQLPIEGMHFLQMGSTLSIVNDSSKFLREVWEMDPENGEWTMLLRFDIEPLSSRFKDLFCKCSRSVIPCGWLAVKEVLIFITLCSPRRCIASYNIKTREIQSFDLDANGLYHFQAHVNSLVWLEGEF